MSIIWYNPDEREYKYGDVADFNKDLRMSETQDNYTVLMKFNKQSKKLARRVIKQLNDIDHNTKFSLVI